MALWITSIEDLRAALAAIPAGADRSRLESAPEWAPACHRLGVWQQSAAFTAPRPRGGLGLTIPAAVLSRFAPGRPRLTAAQRLGAAGSGPALPGAVNWAAQFPGVLNQGPRGTCVAFASTALREHVSGFATRFSEQFCYWACKRIDGSPDAGTTLAMAATALERFGACPEERWPYSPQNLAGNEGHHPPPPDAEKSALEHRLPGWRLLNAQDVRTLKETLAGANGAPASPVVIGVAVFSSSFDSFRAYSTGEIALPFPAETPVGGHAMCAVGYVDDESVPGGGYFIVRNSWGAEWAAQNRHAPGHALIPYAYMAYFCFEAFTAPAIPLAAPPAVAGPWSAYLALRPAEAPATERREWLNYEDTQPQGNLLPEGRDVPVLVQPLRPREFRSDSPENRERFLRQWCAWSVAGAELVTQAAFAAAPTELRQFLDRARQGRERHLGALDANLMAAGIPFPYLQEPWLVKLAPYEWEPTVQSARIAVDLTEVVLGAWETRHRSPESEPWPAPVRQLLRETVGVRVYALTGFNATVHVLVAWFTPLVYRLEGVHPVLTRQATDRVFPRLANEAYAAWRAASGATAPKFAFHSFGFAGPHENLPRELGAVVSAGHWELYWTHDTAGDLVTAQPDRVSDRLSLRDFSDRLVPITFRERVARVKAAVDELRDEGYGGRITVALVRRRTGTRHRTSGGEQFGYRQSVVLDAFLKLQDEAPDRYRVEKADKGDDLSRGGANVVNVRVVEPKQNGGEQVTLASVRKRFLREHALGLLAALVGSGIPALVAIYAKDSQLTAWQSILAGACSYYVGSLISKAINRRAERSAG